LSLGWPARLLAAVWLCAGAITCQASSTSLQFCDRSHEVSAQQQDRQLRFAAVVKRELERSGETVALVARAGLDLRRFGLRYSHAGVSLKGSPNAPWSVRQLYYACDEERARIFDQGIAGFVLGMDDARQGYVSIVFVPQAEAAALELSALDNALALRLLAGRYSANAYAFGLRYQNCNQWLVELLAVAWGALDSEAPELRLRAQRWLAASGFRPPPVELNSHLLMFAAPFVPFIHLDDHPEEDRFALGLHVTLPSAIEDFVRARAPGSRRVELCHDEHRIVVRRGWSVMTDGCRPGAQDEVIPFDPAAPPAPAT
jgi:hypothetical protein